MLGRGEKGDRKREKEKGKQKTKQKTKTKKHLSTPRVYSLASLLQMACVNSLHFDLPPRSCVSF